jgi:hypothetical protein
MDIDDISEISVMREAVDGGKRASMTGPLRIY